MLCPVTLLGIPSDGRLPPSTKLRRVFVYGYDKRPHRIPKNSIQTLYLLTPAPIELIYRYLYINVLLAFHHFKK